MELMQLRYFQKAARTKSITKAAQELHISQPTLSQSLSRLESSLGTPLFSHAPGKSLRLNETGEIFLERVDAALAQIEEGVRLVQERASIQESQITIGCSVLDLCKELILSWYEVDPDAVISQQLVPINSLIDMLLDGEIDFAISPCPLSDGNPKIESRPLYTEEQLAVVGPTHRLYGCREIDRSELLHERFICNYAEADRYYLDMLFEQDGSDVDIILESSEPSLIREAINMGLGVAFIPARVIMRRLETGDAAVQNPIRVTGYSHNTPTCISVKKGRTLSPAAMKFYEYVVSFCEKENQMVDYYMKTYFPH